MAFNYGYYTAPVCGTENGEQIGIWWNIPFIHQINQLESNAKWIKASHEESEDEIVAALEPYLLTKEQLFNYGYPVEANLTSDNFAMIYYTPYPTAHQPRQPSESNNTHICARCTKAFNFETNSYCFYHFGKLRNQTASQTEYWSCCHQQKLESGCIKADKHVHIGLKPGLNGPLAFWHTRPKRNTQLTLKVVAIDCEMCFTNLGFEVTKVTVLNVHGAVVYEKSVKPAGNDYDNKSTERGIDDLQTVQRELLEFISAETIIIGHGVENDLRVLRLIHERIIDTAFVYPHHLGFPYRHSLKTLSKNVLKRCIQQARHISEEDAKAALDLMLAKIEVDRTQPSTFVIDSSL